MTRFSGKGTCAWCWWATKHNNARCRENAPIECKKFVSYVWKFKRAQHYVKKKFRIPCKFPMSLETWKKDWKLPF